jgi:hypothetical protein
VLFKEGERVGPGLAGVNDDGFAGVGRDAELGGKHALLRLARREVVVTIESDFA